jgi:hypothetical protein
MAASHWSTRPSRDLVGRDQGTTISSESSAKQAAEFSRDVVDRSTLKLIERVLERRTTAIITEFEEK